MNSRSRRVGPMIAVADLIAPSAMIAPRALRAALAFLLAAALLVPVACRSDGDGAADEMGASVPPPSTAPASEGPVTRTAPSRGLTKPQIILVSDFVVAHPPSQSAQPPRLLPGLLRGVRSDMSQSQLTGQLAQRIVADLQARGFNAARYGGGALPQSGWLVQGTFVEFLDPNGNFVSDRFSKQDVELTMTIDDLVHGRPQPLTDFAVGGQVSGEGAPMMPNPYAAGAKFIVRQVELGGDSGSLAARVADSIASFAP